MLTDETIEYSEPDTLRSSLARGPGTRSLARPKSMRDLARQCRVNRCGNTSQVGEFGNGAGGGHPGGGGTAQARDVKGGLGPRRRCPLSRVASPLGRPPQRKRTRPRGRRRTAPPTPRGRQTSPLTYRLTSSQTLAHEEWPTPREANTSPAPRRGRFRRWQEKRQTNVLPANIDQEDATLRSDPIGSPATQAISGGQTVAGREERTMADQQPR